MAERGRVELPIPFGMSRFERGEVTNPQSLGGGKLGTRNLHLTVLTDFQSGPSPAGLTFQKLHLIFTTAGLEPARSMVLRKSRFPISPRDEYQNLAESIGFEPILPFRVSRFSKPVQRSNFADSPNLVRLKGIEPSRPEGTAF
jgi:hypothetical protein